MKFYTYKWNFVLTNEIFLLTNEILYLQICAQILYVQIFGLHHYDTLQSFMEFVIHVDM